MFTSEPSKKGYEKTASLTLESYWLDNPDRPEAQPPLTSNVSADLIVVGAGFTGLWTALEAAL